MKAELLGTTRENAPLAEEIMGHELWTKLDTAGKWHLVAEIEYVDAKGRHKHMRIQPCSIRQHSNTGNLLLYCLDQDLIDDEDGDILPWESPTIDGILSVTVTDQEYDPVTNYDW